VSLEDLRRQIDELDLEMLRLLGRRAELASAMGRLKRELSMPISDPAREADVLAKVASEARARGLDVELATLAFKAIMGLCKRAQERTKVAFLGPRGTFSEEAALKAFLSEGAQLEPLASLSGVFEAVERGGVDYGVVPIENSVEGFVGEALDLLAASDVRVCGEVEVRVCLNLIAKPGAKLEGVKVVLSHPQALSQCRSFLRRILHNVEVRECSSTAEAVRMAVGSDGAAAIGSSLAATIYGGEVLMRCVEDFKDNYTRFLIIGRKRVERAIGCKTSLIFEVPHTPGSLHKALSPFASRGVNLTCLVSRPIKGRPWEYMFYLEFEGDDEKCLEELKEKTSRVKVLGTFGRLG
jgi:chorismate mutase/prephenate dehydratase